MRAAIEANPNMTEAEAVQVLERSIRILYYRDARSYNKVRSFLFLTLKIRILHSI